MNCPYCGKEFKVVCNMADACKQCKHATPHAPDNCTQPATCYTEREDEPHCIQCEPIAKAKDGKVCYKPEIATGWKPASGCVQEHDPKYEGGN